MGREVVVEPAHSVSKIPLRATEIAALPNLLIDTLFLTANNKQITQETERVKERWIFWSIPVFRAIQCPRRRLRTVVNPHVLEPSDSH